MRRISTGACAAIWLMSCSGGGTDAGGPGTDGGGDDATAQDGAMPHPDAGADGDAAKAPNDGATDAADATGPSDGMPPGDAGFPAGWLYTQGSQIYLSNGNSGTPWMGRGVNVDDIFLCGYDYKLWMPNPDQTLDTMLSGLVSGWKPTFIRISLGMASDPTVTSWLTNPAQYKTPMTGVIEALGKNAGVYVLVTLRSDVSMIGQDTVDGDPEATGLPSDSTTTPDANMFPTGTDAVYQALVDTFAHDSFVLFGLTNEPGGNKLTNDKIAGAMTHAVGTIRAEEDKLAVPHHVVSVQGNGWTSDISFYSTKPLTYDNVVYEVHGYPPTTASYTYANIPVILGEYGSLDANSAPAFYADVEAKHIPNLAWDFESYSDCAPDLLTVNQSATNLVPSAWGDIVKGYLLAH
jgi:hypothetical protein